MRRAVECRPAGLWTPETEIGTVTLPCAERHRRRILMCDDGGAEFLLDLSEAARMADGDGLVLAGGGVIRVVAAEEPVAEVSCADPVHLARVAWHLGNRHAPVQVLSDGRLRFGHDHVLEAMVEGLGAAVTRTRAPFQPEGGAYSGSHAHGEAAHAH